MLPKAGVAVTFATGAAGVLLVGGAELVVSVGVDEVAGSVVGSVGSAVEDCSPGSWVGVSEGTVTGALSAPLSVASPPVALPELTSLPVELCPPDPSPPRGSAESVVQAVSASTRASSPATIVG
ncbi:MAG TPA: hypothetical protein VFM01_10670 [Nakamurella sp.]|nr:hypothetical protein [Nakamurella sp.]